MKILVPMYSAVIPCLDGFDGFQEIYDGTVSRILAVSAILQTVSTVHRCYKGRPLRVIQYFVGFCTSNIQDPEGTSFQKSAARNFSSDDRSHVLIGAVVMPVSESSRIQ